MAPEVDLDKDFRTLGLEPGARPSEVKQAYRRLAKKWHPDRHHLEHYENRALAEEKFREIDDAYRRIAKSQGETSQVRRPAGKGFSAEKPAATKPRAAARSNVRWFSGARHSLSMAAAAFILTFLFAPLSYIAPDRPVRVHKKVKRHRPPEKRYAAPRPETPIAPRASHPALLGRRAASQVYFFTLGSSDSEVLEIQGRPTRILGDTWFYGLSQVHFRNRRVFGYDNFDGSLRVKIEPGVHQGPSPDHITIGSTRQQVLLVQGTPTRIEGKRWYYGFAELIFEDGLVTGYDNYFGTLKMRLIPSARAGQGKRAFFFTKGSTPDKVLAAQGTPTAVHGNRWSYNFDFVLFRDDKVSGVIDSDGELHFANPKASGVGEGP